MQREQRWGALRGAKAAVGLNPQPWRAGAGSVTAVGRVPQLGPLAIPACCSAPSCRQGCKRCAARLAK